MAFFVTIVTDNLAGVLAVEAILLLFIVVGVGGINPNGQYGDFLGMTIPSILAIVLFLLFPSLLGGLSTIEALKSWGLQILRSGLRFLDP